MSSVRKALLFVVDVAAFYGALALTVLIRYGTAEFDQRWRDHLLPFTVLLVV
jgi:hypothetical protein